MARQLRIEFSGAYYHVLSRGNNGCVIFRSDEDRHDFLNILAEMSERFMVEIFAYVLMDNHYHLLLRTLNPNLSKAMQWLGSTYTRRFNLRHSQTGHLFQGRFKGIIIESDVYALTLSHYIHRNPLRAGLVERLADHRWSSYPFYAYGKKPHAWLRMELIQSRFGSGTKGRKAYRWKVKSYSDEKGRIWEDVKYGLVYGSTEFLDHIKTNYLSGNPDVELPQLNRLLRTAIPEETVAKAAAILDCSLEFFRDAKRLRGDDRDKRDVILYYLWEGGGYGNQRLAELFNITYSSVSRRISHVKAELRSSRNNQIQKMHQKLKSKIKV